LIEAVSISGPEWARKTYAIILDGRSVARLALVPLSMVQRRVYVGIELSDNIRNQPFRLLRGLRQHLEDFFAGWEVEAYVNPDNDRDVAFAEFFGLRRAGPAPKENHLLFWRQF